MIQKEDADDSEMYTLVTGIYSLLCNHCITWVVGHPLFESDGRKLETNDNSSRVTFQFSCAFIYKVEDASAISMATSPVNVVKD